jgi:hypothetical protein
MNIDERVFEAVNAEKFVNTKKKKILLSGLILLLALIYLGSAIYSGKAIGIIGGVIYTMLNGLLFFDNFRRKPVRIIISQDRIFMQQTNLDMEVFWRGVTKAVFNGRYLDLYEQNSLRNTFDLQLFAEDQRVAILTCVEENLNHNNLSIKYLNKSEVSPPSPVK